MRLFARSCPLTLALLGLAAVLVARPTVAVPAPQPGGYYFSSYLEDLDSGSIQHVQPTRQTAVSSGGQFVDPLDVLFVPGEGYIVADPDAAGGNGALFRVDPITGVQSVISSGQSFRDPVAVARAQDGSYRVVDSSAAEGDGAVISVHPDTGVQTVLTFGGFLEDPRGIAIEADGDMLVTNTTNSEGSTSGSVIRVIAGKNVQQVLSSGGQLESPVGIAVGSGGEIYVADSWAGTVLRIDPSTGAQTDVATSNSPFSSPWGIAIGTDGQLYVTDFEMLGTGVIRLDPTNGDFSVISSGHLLRDPGGITFAENGEPVVADLEAFSGAGGLIRITPQVTTTVSSGGLLAGPAGLVHTPLGLFVAANNGLSAGGGAIVKVDPITGVQTLIATGGELRVPVGITYSPDGNLYVTDIGNISGDVDPAILRVHPVTGAQSVVVRGGGLVFPFGIVAEANGNLLVTNDPEGESDSGPGAASAMDGTQGAQSKLNAIRSRLPRRGQLRPKSAGRNGTGRSGVAPAAEIETGGVLRINPSTGNITLLAALNAPTGIALDRNGHVLVVTNSDEPGTGLHRLHPVTGLDTPIPGERNLFFAFGIAEAPDGGVLASHFSFLLEPGSIQRYAPGTGDPSIDTSNDSLIWPWGIAVPAVGADAPPVVNAPTSIQAVQNRLRGAEIDYEVQFSDDKPGVTLVCDPPPGFVFPIGTTTVTCTATDSAGQSTTVQFPVTVTAPTSYFWARVFVNGHMLGAEPRRRVVGVVQNRTRNALAGSLTFSLNGGRTVLTSRQLTAMVIDGNQARIFGKAAINRVGNYDFVAYLDDLGPAGSRLDRARIEVSNGIDTGGPFHGEVRINRR